MNVTEIYGDIDDFCKVFLPTWQAFLLPEKPNKRQRAFRMSPAEVMTLLIAQIIAILSMTTLTLSLVY